MPVLKKLRDHGLLTALVAVDIEPACAPALGCRIMIADEPAGVYCVGLRWQHGNPGLFTTARRSSPAQKETVIMKRCVILFSLLLLVSMMVLAAGPKTYQVTGPVLDIKGDVITVQKGTDKWEIALDKATKTTGDLKVGSKVTIEYRMTATSIVVKPAAPPKKP
jgi:hypothetical protein